MKVLYRTHLILLVLALSTLNGEALAQSGGNLAPVDNILDTILDWMTGTAARSFVVISIAVLGFMAWAQALRVRHAVYIVIGIVLVFGAAQIADFLI